MSFRSRATLAKPTSDINYNYITTEYTETSESGEMGRVLERNVEFTAEAEPRGMIY